MDSECLSFNLDFDTSKARGDVQKFIFKTGRFQLFWRDQFFLSQSDAVYVHQREHIIRFTVKTLESFVENRNL